MNRVEIRLPKEAFNEIYRPLLVSRARYLVLCGGAGSGKSVFAVQRCIYRLLKDSFKVGADGLFYHNGNSETHPLHHWERDTI